MYMKQALHVHVRDALTHTHTQPRAHTPCTHTHSHIHTHIHACSHTHVHTHSLTHTHTHTHTHILSLSHTHTHTPAGISTLDIRTRLRITEAELAIVQREVSDLLAERNILEASARQFEDSWKFALGEFGRVVEERDELQRRLEILEQAVAAAHQQPTDVSRSHIHAFVCLGVPELALGGFPSYTF